MTARMTARMAARMAARMTTRMTARMQNNYYIIARLLKDYWNYCKTAP